MQKTIILYLAYLLCVGNTFAQKEANIWFLNDGYGVEFSGKRINERFKGKAQERFDGKMSAGVLHGKFTMCDSLGNLLFYTDGISVWNKEHKAIATDLYGNMNVSVAPLPNKNDIYIIFYTGIQNKSESYPFKDNLTIEHIEKEILTQKKITKKTGLYYSILDVKNEVFLDKNVLISENILNDFCINRHATEKKYWLVVHEANSNKFISYLLDDKGFNLKGIETSIGLEYSGENDYIMKSNIKGNRILLDKVGVDSTCIVWDFNNKLGKLTHSYTIEHQMSKFYVYDYEFSSNGRYIYSVFHKEVFAKDNITQGKPIEDRLMQYDLSIFNIKNQNKYINKPIREYLVSSSSSPSYAGSNRSNTHLQLAMNGYIYVTLFPRGVIALEKPNRLLAGHNNTTVNIMSLTLDSKRFSGKMPKVSHLLPLSLVNQDEEIEIGTPFIREILFETNLSTLKPKYETELQDIVDFLKQNTASNIEISGHTDNEGEKTKNKTLSENRAKALANFLIKNKIESTRIKVIGYGGLKPIADNNTPEGRAKNRRIEFLILEK